MDILIVEDDELQRRVMFDRFKQLDHTPKACDSLTDARKRLAENSFHLIFLDRNLPDGDGVHFLSEVSQIAPSSYVVIVTGFSDIPSAVQAIRNGAYDYLSKPYEDEQLQKILRNVEKAVRMEERAEGLARLSSGKAGDVWQMDEMIGGDALRDMFTKIQKIAGFPNTTVLLLGESGTGKGLMAGCLHRASSRANKPFVDINCSAIPSQLLESEVFGYDKGAFTDAKNSKPGLLEIADGGTVFLDEIGDMPPALQAKLLKVIEDKKFRRLGGSKIIQIDVRIIAATCRDLPTMIKEGTFREDLYYRLSVFPLTLPPLREHPESIPQLASQCLNQCNQSSGHSIKGFTTEAMNALTAYRWPGNVRELRNAIERATILCSGDQIDAEDLGIPSPRQGNASENALQSDGKRHIEPMTLVECEKMLIECVLETVDGHKGKAAEILDIHRSSLYKKISAYGIDA